MANISSSNTSTDPNKDECIATINEKTFDLWCLAPALVIILILSCLKRRSNFKLDYCNGHPGLLIPINFFGSFKNRFTIAATFGATASTFFTNAKSGLFTIPGPAWVTIFDALVAVLVYGILFYPFFACLTTEYKLVGSLLGFLYVSMRLSLELVIDFQCKSSYEKHEKTYQYIEMLGGLPTYLCLLFIAMRFGVLLFLEVRHKWLKCTSERRYQAVGVVACLIEKQGIVHVRQLLNPGITSDMADEKWYTRLIYRIYKPRADFKFSAQLISTLVVAVIILFQFLIKIVIILEKHKRDLESNSSAKDSYDALVRLVFGSLQGGYIVAAFFAILILLHFMKCHRDHVFQLYRGKMAFCQDVFVSPAQLVGRSLRFSGYQIAYVFTGNVIMGLFMAIIAVILGFIFKYAKDIFNAETLNGLKEIAITMVLPTVSMAIFLWGFQVFLELFVFRDRDFPNNITITVDNKRLFSIMSYLFFFYNILLGVFSCLVRILKGMFLGVVFLSRIDRTSMMQGFQTWDKAFVAYLGFIHVLVAHSHPVMLMFCQLLINRNKDENLQESPEQAHPRELHFPRMSHQAINRWFLAVTLLRNPSLIKYRRQGGVRPIVTIYGITNHNYDSNALL